MTTSATDRGLAVPLTEEQEEAVERRRGALLLAANAGSGKTTVLVERFVRAVTDDGVSPGRILAITFTERAAGELRERVRRRLLELGERAAARETEAAFVSTIHGFCARLLRTHSLAAGLAPGFGVLDEGTAAGLRQEAFDRALAGWMTGPAELDLAAAVGIDQLTEAITRAHDELRSRGVNRPVLPSAGPRHEPEAALAGLREAGAALARELAAGPGRAGRRVIDALDQLARLACREQDGGSPADGSKDAGSPQGGSLGGGSLGGGSLGGGSPQGGSLAGDLLGGGSLGGGSQHGGSLGGGLLGGGSLDGGSQDGGQGGGAQAGGDEVGVKFGVGPAGMGVTLEELKLHRGAAALKTAAAEAYEAARGRCCEVRDDAVGVAGLELLGRLLDDFAGEFAAAKRGRGALDFDDLELSARDLLHGDAELRERWSERFDLLMVDELQDTNPREMSILEALDRGNLFTVGDEFQSIYAFRHADVGIFRQRRRELGRGDGVRALSRNFRSRPPLVAAINATFGPIFGPDFVPLVAGRDEGPEEEPVVELMLSDSAGWQETAPGETPGPGPPWRRAEARLLAGRIAELIGSGGTRPREIVVLLRYATAAGVYGQALAERGIPIAAALGGGFYAAQEISDLGAYVRVLANPLDDVALYGVLASPLCGLRADGLAVVGLAAKGVGRPPWELLAAAGAGDPQAMAALAGLSADDAGRLASVRALIERERPAAAGLGLAELLVRSGYRERALDRPGGALGLANFHKLLRLAREFEAREGRDLRGFADRLAAGRLGSSREQHAQLAETDAVRLMTVHAAKGLEFPVVCVADLGHGPPIGAPVILTDGERVGLRLPRLDGGKKSEAFAYTELRARQGAAALAEEQRIGYVAMTRARERLILSGAAHFARWPTPGPFAAAIAWVARAMVVDLEDRLAGPTGVSELELGGARVRLTLTAAGDMPAVRDVGVPGLARGPGNEPADPCPEPAARPERPEPPGRRRRRRERPAESVEYEQISLFADPEPADQERAPPAENPRPAAAGPDDHPPPVSVWTPAGNRGPVSVGPDHQPRPASDRPGGHPPPVSVGPPAGDPRPASVGPGGRPEPVASGPGGRREPATRGPADHPQPVSAGPAASAGAGSMAWKPSPAHLASLPPPSSISYSSLVDHGRCGYGYYLRRVLGLAPVPPPPGLQPAAYDAAERGRVVHALLERLDFARPGVPSAAQVRAQALGEPTDEEIAAIAELAGAFARSPLSRRLAAAETAVREASFATTVGGLLVNGYIDVLAHEAGGSALVVDYKTDRVDPDTDLAARVAAEYDVQRQIYGLAALRSGAAGVEVAYCFLRRPEEVVGVRYAAGDAAGLEAGLLRLAAPLLAGAFEVADRPHRGLCATCPGRARLCSWDEALTLREDPRTAGSEQAGVQDA